jgi:GH24 family phage-related lysozyme (muramidase)
MSFDSDAVETDQFNEGVKELLATFLGLGAIVMSGAKSIEDNLAKRPESNREKITALQAADKLIKAPQFHQAANTVIADLEAKEQRKEKREDNAAKKAAGIPVKAKEAPIDPVIKKASDFILPSEVLGNDIESKKNDKFMIPYKDDVGKWTIGIGHLIGKGSLKDKEDYVKDREAKGLKLPLSRPEAIERFMKDVSTRVSDVEAKFKKQWPMISDNLKAALIDIKFRGDLDNPAGGDFDWVKLIKAGEYKKAAQAYLDHKEYKARMLKKGTKGDGVVSRMNRNAEIISNEAGSKAKKTTGYAKVAATGR